MKKYQLETQVLLLCINNVPSARGIITGKIFEYLQAKRPILAIGPEDGDAAEILKNTNSGSIFGFENKQKLKQHILELYKDYKKNQLIVNSENIEALKMGEIFHYGLSPALLSVGLILILARNCTVEVAKNILIGYIVGTLVLMYVFFGILTNEPLINFTIESAAPDIVFLAFSVFAYVKAK